MRFFTTFLVAMFACLAPVVAQQEHVDPGFSCTIVSPQQAVSNSDVWFRVVRLQFAAGATGNAHGHDRGEILYLLTGSGVSVGADGTRTPLTQAHALVMPPHTVHDLVPTPGNAMTLLSIQFYGPPNKPFEPKSSAISDVCK